MAEYITDAPDVIMDFIRTHLVDPRARAEASESDTTASASAGQTEFELSATVGTVSCITSVTVDGTSKSKWEDYHWDYQTEKVTFFTAMTGGEAVVITYKYGNQNWVYSDKVDKKLSSTSFPRIAVFMVSGSGKRLGQYNAPVESAPMFQIDIWTRKDQVFTIDGRKYSNDYHGRYIGGRITKAFEDSEEDLHPVLYGYIPASIPRAAPESVEYLSYHTVVEVNFKGLDLGRIET